MPGVIYNCTKAMFAGDADWASPAQTYKALLAGGDYEPKASHRKVSDVEDELTGKGYERQTLHGRSIVANETDGRADCHAEAVTFGKLATKESYRWLVVYRERDSDARSELVCAVDMDEVSLAGISEHTIRWDGEEKQGRVSSLR
jgi:hypothetical protein